MIAMSQECWNGVGAFWIMQQNCRQYYALKPLVNRQWVLGLYDVLKLDAGLL